MKIFGVKGYCIGVCCYPFCLIIRQGLYVFFTLMMNVCVLIV